MIKLPSFEWFMGNINFHGKGNRYSGSAGCDPLTGISADRSFRYSVWIDTDGDDMMLRAGYYSGPLCYEATDKEIITENTFEVKPQGVADAQAWLTEAAEKFCREKGVEIND